MASDSSWTTLDSNVYCRRSALTVMDDEHRHLPSRSRCASEAPTDRMMSDMERGTSCHAIPRESGISTCIPRRNAEASDTHEDEEKMTDDSLWGPPRYRKHGMKVSKLSSSSRTFRKSCEHDQKEEFYPQKSSSAATQHQNRARSQPARVFSNRNRRHPQERQREYTPLSRPGIPGPYDTECDTSDGNGYDDGRHRPQNRHVHQTRVRRHDDGDPSDGGSSRPSHNRSHRRPQGPPHRPFRRYSDPDDPSDGHSSGEDERQPRRRNNRQGSGAMRKPEIFDGESMEWPDYLELFQAVAEWNGWTSQEKAKQLKMSLRGQALRVLKPLREREKSSFTKLCAALEDAFDPPERVLTHKAAFKGRTKAVTESANQYSNTLKRLATKAYPSRCAEDLEEIILDQFLEGLGDERLQEHVILSHPVTTSQAVRIATEYESLKSSRAKHAKKPLIAVAQGGSSTEQNSALEGKIDKLLDRVASLERKSNSSNGQESQFGGKQPNQRGKPNWRENITCFKCGQKGHIARYCSLKKQPATGATPATQMDSADRLKDNGLSPQPQAQPQDSTTQ